jgi:hypothetical protein
MSLLSGASEGIGVEGLEPFFPEVFGCDGSKDAVEPKGAFFPAILRRVPGIERSERARHPR